MEETNFNPSCEPWKYYVVGMWCFDENMPFVWSHDGSKTADVKEFDTKEEAIAYINEEIEFNVNICWTISREHPRKWKKALSQYDKFKEEENKG